MLTLTPKQITPFIVSLALFMEAVDSTVINTAIPVMANSLGVNPLDLKIALISYLLSLAIFIPISGWIADKFGIKRVFMTALFIFTLSSVWCGYAHTLPELVIARCIQGLGGSLTLPVGRLLIVRTFARHELVAAMSRVVIIGALGMMLGPVLGGLITHYFSWRWIFWINLPAGAFALIISQHYLTPIPPKAVHALDKLGFILFGAALAGFTFGMSALSETTLPIAHAVIILLSAVILLLWYSWHSRKLTHPIVKMTLFDKRTFRISAIGNLVSRLGFGGITFLLPLLLQIGFGYSVQVSGLMMAPMALGVLLVKPFSLYVIRFLGFKRLLILNTVCVGLSLWSLAYVDQHTPLYLIGLLTFLFGFLMSLQYSGMNSLAYADIYQEDLSAATSILSVTQQLAQSFGVATGALFVRYFSAQASPPHMITASVFHHTFIALAVLTLFSILVFIRLKREDGHQLIEQPQIT